LWDFRSQSYTAAPRRSRPDGGAQTRHPETLYYRAKRHATRFNNEMAVDVNANRILFADQFTTTPHMDTLNWLNFHVDEGGRGHWAGFEYDELDPGPDVMDEHVRPAALAAYRNKTSVSVHGAFRTSSYDEWRRKDRKRKRVWFDESRGSTGTVLSMFENNFNFPEPQTGQHPVALSREVVGEHHGGGGG